MTVSQSSQARIPASRLLIPLSFIVIGGGRLILTLLNWNASEERRAMLAIALRNADGLRRLVDELMELSRLEARQVAPAREAFPLAELAQATGRSIGYLSQIERGLIQRTTAINLFLLDVYSDQKCLKDGLLLDLVDVRSQVRLSRLDPGVQSVLKGSHPPVEGDHLVVEISDVIVVNTSRQENDRPQQKKKPRLSRHALAPL